MNQLIQELKNYTRPLLISMYIAGIIGYLTPISSWFRYLTAFNLVLSSILVLIHQTDFSKKHLYFLIFTFFYGFIVEYLGVTTQMIFGTYFYGATLAPKLWDIPIIIGVNWYLTWLLSDSVACYLKTSSNLLHSIVGASLMVLLDILIEPVANHFDFWHWENATIPIQNYVAWWVLGFILHFLAKNWLPSKQNPIAVFLYIIQLIFFAILNTAI